MSWGENSCIGCPTDEVKKEWCHCGRCSVDCPYYKWDGKTKPSTQPFREFSEFKYSKSPEFEMFSKSKTIPKKEMPYVNRCERRKKYKHRQQSKKES